MIRGALRYVSRRPLRFVGLALVAAGAAWLLSNQYGDSADLMAEGIGEDDLSSGGPGEDDVMS